MPREAPRIRLVVFDWAGTTVDHGSFGPVAAFIEAFASRRVEISSTEARGPMGLHKKEHIRVLLQLPQVAERWLAAPFADLIGIEHRFNEQLPAGGERRKYGGTVITLYRVEGRGLRV